MWISIAFLVVAHSTMSVSEDPCDLLRNKLANSTAEFVSCAINNSRPVTLCSTCVESYLDILDTYQNMTKLVDNSTHCIDRFVHLDRLEIVNSLYSNSYSLWNDAKCYICFESDNGTLTANKSDQAERFYQYYDNFTSCVTEYNGSDTTLCTHCMNNYTTLYEYYYEISNENERIGTCMDMVDLMNTTMSFWSQRCCKYRRHQEYIFIASTIVVLIATLCFYVLAQFCSVRKAPMILHQRRLAESFNQTSALDE